MGTPQPGRTCLLGKALQLSEKGSVPGFVWVLLVLSELYQGPSTDHSYSSSFCTPFEADFASMIRSNHVHPLKFSVLLLHVALRVAHS